MPVTDELAEISIAGSIGSISQETVTNAIDKIKNFTLDLSCFPRLLFPKQFDF